MNSTAIYRFSTVTPKPYAASDTANEYFIAPASAEGHQLPDECAICQFKNFFLP